MRKHIKVFSITVAVFSSGFTSQVSARVSNAKQPVAESGMPEYWIQLHDYSSTTYQNASLGQVRSAFHAFDWRSELEKFDRDDPEKDCPPGIGISNGIPLSEPGAIVLHICPLDDRSMFLNIHCSESGKWLGLFPRVKKTINYIDSYDISQVDSLIGYVFCGDHRALLAVEK